MTTTPMTAATPGGSAYADAARDHLWMHFTPHSTYEQGGSVPVIVRGEGHRIWDDHGKEYIDGLAGLFVVQVGHGRVELAEAAAKQASELALFPLWSYAHPRAIELAERLAAGAPGDLNRVFFTCAKGMTSGYSPIGAMIASERLFEPFKKGTTSFPHGYTFGGHPVSSAVAMANLDIFEREGLNDHVKQNAPVFRSALERLLDLPIVGDIRGAGFFYGIELVKDKDTRETFNDAESERLLRGYLSKALFDAGIYCRADDRGDPVIQLAPPLTIGPAEFDDIESRLRSVLKDAGQHL